MNSLLTGYLKSFEVMMKSAHQRDRPDRDEDLFCRYCRHYRPNWKYRYCRFVECPYINGIRPFRKGGHIDAG